MSLFAFDKNQIKRIKKMLSAFESGRLGQMGSAHPTTLGAPIEVRLAKTQNDIPGLLIDDDDPEDIVYTVSSGTVPLYKLNSEEEMEDTELTTTAYNLSRAVVLRDQFVQLVRDPISGKFFIVQPDNIVRLGKTTEAIDKTESGLVEIYDGDEQGEEEGTGITVTAYNRWRDVGDGKWVLIATINSGWEIILAECDE